MIKNQIRRNAFIIGLMILVILIPAAVTLKTVLVAGKLVLPSDNPTPLGYTISLSLFLVPGFILAIWLLNTTNLQVQKKAFAITLIVLVPTGFILDFLFGNQFFTFTNHNAVTGFTFPAIGGPLPVEELIFFLSGFTTVLLMYVWCDEFWLAKYNIANYTAKATEIDKIIQFHLPSLLIGSALIATAIFYKLMVSGEPGLPWYFIYLTTVALIPSMALYRCARDYINWRAFSLTFVTIVLISLLWEVTLALPYGWWNFQHENMMGIYIKAWHDLPIEEIVVWFSVSLASVIFYESIKVWLASGKRLKQVFW